MEWYIVVGLMVVAYFVGMLTGAAMGESRILRQWYAEALNKKKGDKQ